MINRAINDLRNHLNARVLARAHSGAFWTFCAYYVNWVVALNMA